MSKLLKYEFRKSRNILLIILILAAVGEAGFLLGLPLSSGSLLTAGVMILTLTGSFGFLLLAVAGIDRLYRELNSKTSYMLFLTPRSTYQILGAKLVESIVSLALTAVIFGLLAVADLCLFGSFSMGGTAFFRMVMQMFGGEYTVTKEEIQLIALVVLMTFGFWVYFVMTAFLAIILQATVLNGRKGGGWLSFLFFLVLFILVNLLGARISNSASGSVSEYFVYFLVCMGFTVLYYFLGSRIMDRKLSV